MLYLIYHQYQSISLQLNLLKFNICLGANYLDCLEEPIFSIGSGSAASILENNINEKQVQMVVIER